ncbi:MAG: Smr/MutS family protein [Flavobacteriales bacterium]
MLFTLGENVSLLDEAGIFTLVALTPHKAVVRDEHGFEISVDQKRLVKRMPITGIPIPKDSPERLPFIAKKTESSLPTIDLHAEALGLINVPTHEILVQQLVACKRFINGCIQKKEPKILLVHGVGDGTLRTAVRQMLQNRTGIQFHDGNYSPRGVGSTLVLLSLSKVEPL